MYTHHSCLPIVIVQVNHRHVSYHAALQSRVISWSSSTIAAQNNPVGEYIRAELNRTRELLPIAVDLGVPILLGTDELAHGALAQEMAIIQSYGLSSSQVLAVASTNARTFLGFMPFAPAMPADLITFASDPRNDLSVVSRPSAIVFDGQRVY